MLEFFRKFQKIFFFVVAVLLIVSFFFFGIYSALPVGAEVEDRPIGRGIDGSEIKSLAMGQLIRFLSSDQEESLERGALPNFLNDGVIRKDFLETGLGALLTASYFDELKVNFETKLADAKRYRPYAHPDVPFLSVQAVWDQFRPNLSRSLALLKSQSEANVDTFRYLSELYLEQKRLSPEVVRRILVYQMGQYPSLKPDPSIRHQDFSLFSHHSFRDWFGEVWIEKTASFIWNAAIAAGEKGFSVTKEEAKADLLLRMEEASRKYPEASISLQNQARSLGMTEKEAIETWQKVMLFRRYVHSVGEAVLLDHVLSQDLADFAEQTVLADMYSLPEALHLKTAEDFFGLQYYLDQVAVLEQDKLALPSSYLPLDAVEKKSPQFVETVYAADVSRVSLAELSLRVPLKEVLQWQFVHWDLLCSEFSILPKSASTRSEQAASLEKIASAARAEIDAWTRRHLLDHHSEWLEQAFQEAPSSRQTFSFSAGRTNVSYVQNSEEFAQMLDLALLGEEKAVRYLSSYSDGGSTLYRISHVEKTAPRQIRTLASMKQDGTLKKALDRYLELQYPKIREASPEEFKSKAGEWKPFHEVKEQIGWAVFAHVCKAIETKEKLSKPSSDQYIRYRLAHFMRSALQSLQETGADMQVLPQFQLAKHEKRIERKIEQSALEEEALCLQPHEWSSLQIPKEGKISFLYIKEKNGPSRPNLESLAAGKSMLSREAMHTIAKRILHRMQEKHV